MVTGKRYAVFSIKRGKGGATFWVRAGVAFVNKDDSMNLYLDVLPLDGQLHVREAVEKKEQAASGSALPQSNDGQPGTTGSESWEAQKAMGGH